MYIKYRDREKKKSVLYTNLKTPGCRWIEKKITKNVKKKKETPPGPVASLSVSHPYTIYTTLSTAFQSQSRSALSVTIARRSEYPMRRPSAARYGPVAHTLTHRRYTHSRRGHIRNSRAFTAEIRTDAVSHPGLRRRVSFSSSIMLILRRKKF